MTSYPRVLISVLNYNGVEDTIQTIKCIIKQTYANFDILIVDSASNNDCVEKIKRYFSDIRIICLDKNLGYTGGNNVAFEIGVEEGYDYVLICNDDIEIEKELVATLIETAQNYDSVGVVGVIEKDFYSGEIRAIGGFEFDYRIARGKWIKKIPCGSQDVIEVDYAQGAFTLFSRAALVSGIRFDEKLFMYCEEVDLSFQLKNCNLRAYVDTRCHVRHKSVQKKFNLLQGYYLQRNRIYICIKHFSFPYTFISIIYFCMFELPLKTIIRSIQGNYYYAWVCLLGFLDGLLGKMDIGRGFRLK